MSCTCYEADSNGFWAESENCDFGKKEWQAIALLKGNGANFSFVAPSTLDVVKLDR